MLRTTAPILALLVFLPACGRDGLYATGASGEDLQSGTGSDVRDAGPGGPDADSADAPDAPVLADTADDGDTSDIPGDDVVPDPPPSFTEPTPNGRAAQIYLAGFSPDGRWLAWVDVGDGIDQGRLHIVDTDSGATRMGGAPVVVITAQPVQFSADSRHIAFRTSDGERGGIDFGPIHVLELGTDRPALRLMDGAIRRSFRFTPDGERLVFNTMGGLYVHQMDTGQTDKLADYARYSPYVPVDAVLPMSADGRYLAYDNRRALHLVDFETGTDVVVDDPVEKYTTRFSAAGDRISWVQGRAAAGRLHIRSLDSGETEFVGPEGLAVRLNADWSRVAYLHGATQSGGYRQAELLVTEVETGTTHIVGDRVDGHHYRFSPNGRDLVFLRARDASYDYTGALHIWDGQSSRRLEESVVADWENLDRVAFGPSGRYLVYETGFDYPDRRTVMRELATDRTMDLGSCVQFLRDGITGFGLPPVVAHCALFLPDGDVIYGSGAATGVALTRRSPLDGAPRVVAADSNVRPRVSPGLRLMATYNFTSEADVRDMLATDLESGTVHTLAAGAHVLNFLAADNGVAFVTEVDHREQVVWFSRYGR